MLPKILTILLITLCLGTQTYCIQQFTTARLHRYYDDHYYHSGMSKFAALIIGIIAGVLCFLGIMYYFKWRRQTGGQLSFFDMFRGRSNPQQPQYGYQGQQNQAGAHYVPSSNQGAPGYYNNPNYPNYPPL